MQPFALQKCFILALFSLSIAASGLKSLNPCSDDFLQMEAYKEMISQVNTTKCRRLSTLEAQFAWNINKTSNNHTQITVLIATKLIPAHMGWLAWGVNPELPRMVGTRAIIAIKLPNQTTPLLNTYNITKDVKLGCKLQPSPALDFRVQNMAAVSHAGFFAVFATLVLPDQRYDISRLNHVWQVGRSADGSEPKMHWTSLGNFDSKEVLDLETGRCRNIGRDRQHLRKDGEHCCLLESLSQGTSDNFHSNLILAGFIFISLAKFLVTPLEALAGESDCCSDMNPNTIPSIHTAFSASAFSDSPPYK
ncbi:hypothetical protein V6N12_076187 [Hibiscus sabdariffa]|uniref:DOMON domain-containing protein n=1 Tax=Hibiscus sabdariffa TaxID=183260 RepID=A0ABR2AM37_9ROSI